MSSYEANPVGFLHERYSAGATPKYDVVQKGGQAHAPVFEAILTVPEGLKVTATGSSKKIAKNIAAKMMLDKLDGKGGKEKTTIEIKDDTAAAGDTNNNVEAEALAPNNHNIPILADQPSAAASVTEFYLGLQKSSGYLLDKLHNDEICLAAESVDFVEILEQLAAEQNFRLQFVQVESLEGVEQSLVQMFSCADKVVTVCLGQGEGSKNSAARFALMYIKTMSKPAA